MKSIIASLSIWGVVEYSVQCTYSWFVYALLSGWRCIKLIPALLPAAIVKQKKRKSPDATLFKFPIPLHRTYFFLYPFAVYIVYMYMVCLISRSTLYVLYATKLYMSDECSISIKQLCTYKCEQI